MSFYSRYFKRVIDVLVSSILLVFSAPIMAFAAVGVFLTDGKPVIFAGPRLGRDMVPFPMLKFRTMYRNAPDIRNEDGSTFNSSLDPRVTPFGRFLRSTSIDELPQLFNVVRGEMSLIGPRPSPLGNESRYPEWYLVKFDHRPGITGLSQARRRNAATIGERMKDDKEYVSSVGAVTDLRIVLMTIGAVFNRRGIFRN